MYIVYVKAGRKKALLWGFKRTNQPTFALFPSLSIVNDGVILESVAVGWWAVTITQADDEGSAQSQPGIVIGERETYSDREKNLCISIKASSSQIYE